MRGADKTGIPAGGDLFTAVGQWAAALGTVTSPTEPVAVTDDVEVAAAIVQTSGGGVYVFGVLNLKSGKLVYGEIAAASVDLLNPTELGAFVRAIAVQ